MRLQERGREAEEREKQVTELTKSEKRKRERENRREQEEIESSERERERCGCWKTCAKEGAHSEREKTKSERTRECNFFGNDNRVEVESEEVKGGREIEWL